MVIDILRAVAELETPCATMAKEVIQLRSRMFDRLGFKLTTVADQYHFDLKEKYGDGFTNRLTECYRVTLIALNVEAKTKRSATSMYVSMAWIGAKYLVDGIIKSPLLGRVETHDEVADFLDCMGLALLIVAANHAEKNETDKCCSFVFEAMEARHLSDHVLAAVEPKKSSKEVLSEFGRAGALARHQENHQMKADVFEWCDANMGSYNNNGDAAASAIMTAKLVPATWRSVRNWITQWKKQSAGTA